MGRWWRSGTEQQQLAGQASQVGAIGGCIVACRPPVKLYSYLDFQGSALSLPGWWCRYSWNWLKIRAFGLTQYDAILLMDSDAIVVGNVRQVFDLPTDFAAIWDQSKWMNK